MGYFLRRDCFIEKESLFAHEAMLKLCWKRGDNMYDELSIVLSVKIALTVLFWCGPMLLFPRLTMSKMGFSDMEPIIYIRLLGVAYLALVVGYCFGLKDALYGVYPKVIVLVGIVSNGGAAMIIGYYDIFGYFKDWEKLSRNVMRVSMVLLLGITLGLCYYGVWTQWRMSS